LKIRVSVAVNCANVLQIYESKLMPAANDAIHIAKGTIQHLLLGDIDCLVVDDQVGYYVVSPRERH
jgi:hypothetical protein